MLFREVLGYLQGYGEVEPPAEQGWFGEIRRDERLLGNLELCSVDVVTVEAEHLGGTHRGEDGQPRRRPTPHIDHGLWAEQVDHQGYDDLGKPA